MGTQGSPGINGTQGHLAPTGPVYVAWRDNPNILFRASNDTGQTFGVTINISNGVNGIDTDIASFGQNVYVVWSENIPGGDSDILFRTSNDGGKTFGNIQNLSNNPGESQLRVLLRMDKMYMLYGRVSLLEELLMRFFTGQSTDGGLTFGVTQNLSGGRSGDNPDIYAYGQNVYVIWNAFNPSIGNREILFRTVLMVD